MRRVTLVALVIEADTGARFGERPFAMVSNFNVATDPIRNRLPNPNSFFGSASGVGVVVRQSVVGLGQRVPSVQILD